MAEVIVKESNIHGLGVFATRDFAPGEVVLLLDDSRLVDADHPLCPEAGEFQHHCDYLAGGKVVLQLFPERHINSSCAPNTYVNTLNGIRRVLARRAIKAGEEVSYDYIINCHGGLVWRCRCGSAKCRGTVPASFFDLSAEEQLESVPLLDGWFVAEHREQVADLLGRADI